MARSISRNSPKVLKIKMIRLKRIKRIFGSSNALFFLIALVMAPSCELNLNADSEVYIRFNQLGFNTNDYKSAVILSKGELAGKSFSVISAIKKEEVYTGVVPKNLGQFGNFAFTYDLDFSSLKIKGEYYIQLGRKKSSTFKIGENVYSGLADSLLKFFTVQRCGYTNPYLHKICHIADATSIIDGKKIIQSKYDVTGGWHDAGDYVKFLNTTAFSTYMLIFSYEFDPVKFGFDHDKNGVPDLLDEAKIGLDWMLRCAYSDTKFITQVQDLRDHDVGWRMPEDDKLGFDRPAFLGMGKNLIGIYSATMALASRIWKDKIHDIEFSKKCLSAAEKYFSVRKKVADIDTSGTGHYRDEKYFGKLSLAAIELYQATSNKSYLDEAAILADSAKSDYWWSWGNINSLADYKLAKIFPKYSLYIKNNLDDFNKRKNNNLFNKGTELSWGTNVTLLGISLQNILYKRLTGDASYDSLSVLQRDFILGRNQWGVSFISNAGKNHSKNFHHQIGYIKGNLPGGFAAGPAKKEFVQKSKINFEKQDEYFLFQTDEDYYRDDRMDYITNEPTITGNATAIFVFGNLAFAN